MAGKIKGFGGSKICLRRVACKLSQKKLAMLCGVHTNTAINWDYGSVPETDEMLQKIAEVLECKTEDLV